MSQAHHRRKQPERVRQKLLDVAARLSLEQGASGVTLDAVSQAAGVSKGGLLHHFPSKPALIDGLFDDLIGRLDRSISDAMRLDPDPHGRFTRAYLKGVFACHEDAQGWQMLTIALLSEPRLRARWRQWVEERTKAHADTDGSPSCLLARLGADGLWLADLLKSHDIDSPARDAMLAELIRLSRH